MATSLTSGVDWTGIMGTAGTFLMWMFLLVMVIGLAFIVYYMMSFKNTIIIRKIVNGRKQIKKLKWKVVKDKKGIRWLVTPFYKWFGGFKRAVPNHRALDISKGDRLHVEAWYDVAGDNLIWVQDDFDMDKFLEEHLIEYEEDGEKKKKLSSDYATKFNPLDTNDRELLVSEMIRSKQYGKKSGWEVALQLAIYMVPIIMVVVFAMTIGEVTTALNDYTGPVTSAANNIAESLERASMHIANAQDFGNPSNIGTNSTGGAPN